MTEIPKFIICIILFCIICFIQIIWTTHKSSKIFSNYEKKENGIVYKVEIRNGDKAFLYKKKLHRELGPALELTNGNKYWFKHGKYHREDGPAIIKANGKEEYWLNDIYYPNVNSVDELLIASIIE